jgi:hypothetical protein
MNAKRVLTINWGLWACFSLPPIIYFLFHREQDKAGDRYSGWAILAMYANSNDWLYSWEVLLPRIVFPIVIGWVAQYLLVIAWNYWRRKE